MSDWDRIDKLIRTREYDELLAVARGLDDADRKALVGPLKEFERHARSGEADLWHSRSCFAIIGAGVLTGASVLAPWLVRNGFRDTINPFQTRRQSADLADSVLDILEVRDVPWLPDLARRLADRLSASRFDWGQFRMVTNLVKLTGIDPPPTDGLVLGLAAEGNWADRALGDPRWLAVVPRMFEVAGVGRIIEESAYFEVGWPQRIAELAANGKLDRGMMIDGAIAALQRGGRLGDVRGFLKVYEALEPDLPEIVDRLRDYVPILADAHSSVAGVAQRELFRADDAGKLPVDLLLDVSHAVFLRSEKKLVRAQLDRLDRVIGREPGRVDDVLLALGVVFEHDAADIQAKALDVVLAHASAVAQRTRDELAAVASALPADLRAKAAKALGTVDAPQTLMTTLPPVPEAPVLPTPVGSLADIVVFLYGRTLRGRGGGRMLTTLSHTVDQMGEDCARAFAHGLDAHDKNDRAEAVDALLVLAARDRWNPAALGQQIGVLAADVELSLNRVVPCLRDLAQSGAASQVWGTVAAALPPMLSPELERPPQRLADLLALAVELVEQVRPTTSIPGLADVAARRGGSRIVTEAKRLEAALPG
nr:DUF6493 family protein [Kibdelosporangium sp. MJ126-NF4]ADB02835.1 AzicU1 [Kibdelosporangium sp. MJ126-NF4]CEL14050.1 secreted protein [Kibdelosporangium sp. MJ126-NF4]CTQ88416.1 secreted protein [Kibdelosporangium sp. MJ126-NF4]